VSLPSDSRNRRESGTPVASRDDRSCRVISAAPVVCAVSEPPEFSRHSVLVVAVNDAEVRPQMLAWALWRPVMLRTLERRDEGRVGCAVFRPSGVASSRDRGGRNGRRCRVGVLDQGRLDVLVNR
jgi:hypothetical protein